MTTPRPVALISGGSRGLGADLVELLSKDGYVVATYSRSASPFIDQMLKSDPESRSFHWESIDSMDFDAVAKFARKVAKRYGRIDALVNNAAALTEGLLPLMKPDDIHRLIAVNLESTILLTRAVSRVMIHQQSGSIVNISSLNGIRGFRGVSVYGATKAGLDGFTRSLARELGAAGIRVNSVAPGYFDSDMTSGLTKAHEETIKKRTPLARLGKARDVAAVVQFFLSESAAFVTGQTIVVDGGLTC